MLNIKDFITDLPEEIKIQHLQPWEITEMLTDLLWSGITNLSNDFIITEGIAIHKTAIIEKWVTLKAPAIIQQDCFVAANAYLRGGVYLGKSVTIGPCCEVKTSIICSGSSIAHFNFIGNSIIGNNVNFEAGSLIANHHNERSDKKIYAFYKSKIIDTGVEKFGALVGDNCKVGANAVLSPGTILPINSIANRLELVEQLSNNK